MSLRRTKLNVPLIQLPSVERDWLIADPSLSLSPVAPVDSALSLLKQERNITMKDINLPLTTDHKWVSNRCHCQSHRTRGKAAISSKFQRNKRCTWSFGNNFRLHPILHHAIAALQVPQLCFSRCRACCM